MRNSILIEFLEVAIHNILYHSNLYPENVFTRKQKYAISIQTCKHPKVNDYIKQCMNSSKHLLQSKYLHKVLLKFFDNGELMCQFAFVVKECDTSISDPYFFKAESQFREFLLKMPSIQTYFKNPLSGEAHFEIALETTERGYTEITHNHEFQDFKFLRTEDTDSKQVAIVPISTDFPVGIHVYAEMPN
ncbi:mitotic spindle assembly checkpoint protein MAD2B [Ctenocephalides felis]|uniref:mitotic spindle assembly checkpoint protein MAD2B n=1 Tax=Ctenocephalides felis TaxID=7515 RepID=UPI000E6E32B0|nr:mitotic spindle assembly checkpoint protein MAD2B [Ctenocephalides felis]